MHAVPEDHNMIPDAAKCVVLCAMLIVLTAIVQRGGAGTSAACFGIAAITVAVLICRE